jgi:uncharacterized protein YndB with AHSA1/START domain
MRSHRHEIELNIPVEETFALLCTPSSIRQWWSASRAIVMAQEGGVWAAAWGDSEDFPDYISAAIIKAYEPPNRLVLGDFKYFAKDGPLPFKADLTTEFQIEPLNGGSRLRVIQTGFPDEAIADPFYAGCEIGWKNTFDGIRAFVEKQDARCQMLEASKE